MKKTLQHVPSNRFSMAGRTFDIVAVDGEADIVTIREAATGKRYRYTWADFKKKLKGVLY